jgi:hypothetical protein
MKHLKHYNIFESIKSTDIKSDILEILSELDTKGNFGYKVRPQYANGPSKRISQKLDIAVRIKIEIMKFRDKERLEGWKRTGALSVLQKFNYSEIEETLLKIEDSIKDRYKAIEGINRSGSSSYQYNINSLSDFNTSSKKPKNSYSSDYDDGMKGREGTYYSITFNIKPGYLPADGKKVNQNIEEIQDVFQDLIDSLEGVKLNIREIGDYTRVILENLKPDKSSTSFGGNAWIPLTDEQKSELKGAILKYEGMYEMSFFDSQVRFKQETPSSLKEKTIKTQEELFEFIDTGKPVSVTIIFKKND